MVPSEAARVSNRRPLFLCGVPDEGAGELVVQNKFTGQAVAVAARAGPAEFDAAIAGAVQSFDAVKRLGSFERKRILNEIADQIGVRSEDLARTVALEAGKSIRDARVEVERMLDTFRIAAEESVRIAGEYLPLDISARARGVESIWKRVPLGVCGFITPFNFPLNLVAHKVAPAIAVGCPFVLKPASATPLSALLLGEMIAATNWPKGAFSILPAESRDAERLVTDSRVKLLSFTGSPAVGWEMKNRAGKKKICLELGGNAACIVDENTDIDFAAERITLGAFYQSGQSCISVQRVLIHASQYAPLRAKLIERAIALEMGDPLSETTFLGPLISEKDAMRVESWIREATQRGAILACGGRRQGAFVEATYLENVDSTLPVHCQEVFGPVAVLESFNDFGEALRRVNDSAFGLQAGVFTKNIDHAMAAFNQLEVGAVIINDVPSFRVDNMPYGGVKDSGLGREGVRFAMEEMTEIRLLVLSRVGQAS